MYISGIDSDRVIQYSLTTPFDISTGTLLSDQHCAIDDIDGHGGLDPINFRFNGDGTKMFILDTINGNTESIDTYSLTTPYDISTCSYIVGSTQTFGGGMEMRDIQFNHDGTMLFIFNQTGNYEY